MCPPQAPSGSKQPAAVRGVRITHPQRTLYPEDGVTKLDLAHYYESVAEWILPHVTHRPLSLVRCPEGHQKDCFYQKHIGRTFTEPVRSVTIREKDRDGTAEYIAIDTIEGLITLIQFGTLEIHPWGARTDDVDKPDRIVFDLDPGGGVEWSSIVETAKKMRDRLDDLGLRSFARITGGKGVHIMLPIDRRHTWDELKAFSRAVAEALVADDDSGRLVTNPRKEQRTGKIFIDSLRNSRGATAVACYSTRARPHAPICTPLRWDELDASMKPDAFTLANIHRRLSGLKADPWQGFFDTRQSITKDAKRMLGTD